MLKAARRRIATTLLTSPQPVVPSPLRRKETVVVGMAAMAVGVWLFAFLMRRYLGLGTGGDMYVNVQLATSWLEGRFLQDRLFGNYLSVHAYFLSPLLAVFVYPLGAPGLLVATALAAALGVVAMVEILRLFGVSSPWALAYAVSTTLMPLSLQVYQIDETGFQVELLIPCLALWLAYFLLRRQWLGSLLLGLALQAHKEDAVFILIPVTVAVICEDFFRSTGSTKSRAWWERWNRPALVVGLVSVLVTPLLLWLVKSQPVQEYHTLGSFAKVHAVDHAPVTGIGSLWNYLVDNLWVWLGSAAVGHWLLAMLAGTWGLVILRPHLLVIGVLTTLTAWLVQGNLMWAPRFAPALALMQVVGCLGFVSVFRLLRDRPRQEGSGVRRTGVLVIGGALIFAGGLYGQYRLAPRCSEVYRLAPSFEVEKSADELRQADELYGRYRRESRPDEPVTASPYLFRYIQDRNFFWATRLHGRPKPVWILWDKEDTSLVNLWLYLQTDAGLDRSDYELVEQAGRYHLFRAWTARPEPVAPTVQPMPGESHGQIRLQVQFSAGRAGTTEPLLSLGRPGEGELFLVHYLNDGQLVLGLDSVGLSVQMSEPVAYRPGQTYELDFFSESLLPPVTGAAGTSQVEVDPVIYKDVVRIVFDGEVVLGAFAPSRRVESEDIFPGFNTVHSGRAVVAFSGKILGRHRGGYPALIDGETQAIGAIRVTVRLPENATGGAEPLVVGGVAGDATLGYLRLMPDGSIRAGADFWGYGAYESDPVAVDRTQPVDLTYAFPQLYPPIGDPRWGGVAEADQARLRSRLQIRVNDKVVLDQLVDSPIPRQPTVVIGENPVGGSVVAAKFTGEVVQVTREPLARP